MERKSTSWIAILGASFLAACAGSGQRGGLCSLDSDCPTGQVCTTGECTIGGSDSLSFSPGTLTFASQVGSAPSAQHASLSSGSATAIPFAIACTHGVVVTPASGQVSSAAAISISIQVPAQSVAGPSSALCEATTTADSTALAQLSLSISSTAVSSGGGSGGGSAGGSGGGSAGGSGGGGAGGSGGGSAGGSGGGSAGGSGGGSAGGSGGGSAGGSGGGSAGGSGGGSAGGSGGGSAGGSGGGSAGGSGGLLNGDFESGLADWTTSGTTSVSTTAYSGSQSAQVGSTTATTANSVSQTFTVPSGAGTLSFWYQGFCNDTVQYAWASATLVDNTTSATQTLLANTCTKTGQWVQVTSSALTAGDSVTLTLSTQSEVYQTSYNYTLFDDVQLSSGSGGGSGGGSAGGSGGGTAGGSGGGTAGGSGGGTAGGSGGGTAGGSGGGTSDGTPTRTATCTPYAQDTGTIINTAHGRLDGYVSFVLPLNGSSTCNGDSGHIHIQVSALGNIYDVAVDVGSSPGDALFYEADMALPDGAWSEGWHNDALSYTSLGISSTQFTSETPATFAQALETELANVNHISVFGTGYTPLPSNGCHDIHYENGSDGALVLEPLSALPHILFFRFSTDTF